MRHRGWEALTYHELPEPHLPPLMPYSTLMIIFGGLMGYNQGTTRDASVRYESETEARVSRMERIGYRRKPRDQIAS